MISSKKGVAGTGGWLLTLILVSVVAVLAFVVLPGFTKSSISSLNACNERGYECLPSCDPSRGDEPFLSGDPACESGVCCRTDETEARLAQLERGWFLQEALR